MTHIWFDSPKRVAPAALVTAFLLVILACGTPAATPVPEQTPTPSLDPTSTPVPGATPTSTPYVRAQLGFLQELDQRFPVPPPEPTWPPRRGGVLHLSVGAHPDLDPVRIRNSDHYLIYDQMMEWEATWYFPEVQTSPMVRNNLVEGWEMVDGDPSVWDFYVRQDVVFQDRPPANGRALTAHDIKYSYDLLSARPGYTAAATIKETEVIDDYTVRMHLNLPLSEFPLLITNGTAPVIVPREGVEAPGGLRDNPGGTGAFVLEDFVTGEGALLTKNPNYHVTLRGEQLPFVDGLRLFFVADIATQTALFRAKQVDLLRPATLDDVERVLQTVPDAWLYRVPSFGWGGYAAFANLEKEPWNDVRVRQALSMAINRQVVLEVVNRSDGAMYGAFPWALGGFEDFEDYTVENLSPYYEYNPDEARRLLEEAGIPEGFEITVEFAEFRGYVIEDVTVLLQRMLENVGFSVNLRQLETSVWLDKRRGGEPWTDLLVGLNPTGSGPTAYDWLYLPYHSSSPRTVNLPYVNDPHVDALLDEWTLAEPQRREEVQRELWEYLNDQVYRTSIMVTPHYRVSQSYVHAGGNPYCWYIGFCTYEAKTTSLTEEAPARGFARFAE